MIQDFKALATRGVQGLHPYQPGKPIEELQREMGLSHIVKLASNENPLGFSDQVSEALYKAMPSLSRYPDGSGYELKKALAGHYGLLPEQLTLGNGSNDVIDLVAMTFLSDGSSAVYSEHAFIVYPIIIQALGARGIEVPATNYGHDLEAMAAAIGDDTRIVFIANPNNPTGTWHDQQTIINFLNKVPSNVLVLLDEAYFEYADHQQCSDGIALLNHYPNLVVTRTFSKAYGLAGLRIGYSVSSPEVAEMVNRIREPFNVNSLALVAGVAALQDQEFVERSRRANKDGMIQMVAGMEKLGLDYIPSAGNFITANVASDGAELYQRLLKRGVIVRPVGVYGLPFHLRFSIGLPEENQYLLDALAEELR